jgi:hypothetical protein
MTKKKSTEQPADELGGLLHQELLPTVDSDDAGDEGEGQAAESKDTVQVQEEKGKPQAQTFHQAPVPAGQAQVRMKDSGNLKTVGIRAAAQLVRLKRAEYVNT